MLLINMPSLIMPRSVHFKTSCLPPLVSTSS
nr:MAG TPA: hypothetical protein [Caudoviricetes sp.]